MSNKFSGDKTFYVLFNALFDIEIDASFINTITVYLYELF